MAREYLTHWVIAGVIVTMTGFAPDHIVAHMIHALNLDHLRTVLPVLDYRLLTVGLGVALIAVDVMVLNHKRRIAATPSDAQSPPAAAEIEIIADKPSIAVLPFVNMSGDKERNIWGTA
ncbi:MAG: hypothetical protein EXR08_08075 [Alphaproteobacteria bacterium]|nr:hypothetical protein [Alphaproteobacteria bacterium]